MEKRPISIITKSYIFKFLKLISPESKKIKINNSFEMYIRPHEGIPDMTLWLGLKFENDTIKKYLNLIQKDDVIVNIGAYIGYWSLITAANSKAKEIHAIEANPRNFGLLKKNVSINNFNNIIVSNLAINEKNGHVYSYFNGLDYACCRITDDKINTEKICSYTLDDYCKEKDIKPNLIQIDVEGAEGKVFLGGKNTFLNTNNVIAEYYPKALSRMGTDPIKFLQNWKQLGFEIKTIKGEIKKMDEIYKLAKEKGSINIHLTKQ